MARKIIVIGAGFSGLSAAAYLSRQGFEVEILEKHSQPGGRARKLEAEGFSFDMGPSMYWMPDVFERFFAHFNTHSSNYYDLVQLNPGYRIFFDGNQSIDIPASQEELFQLFERLEPGSSRKLKKFLESAQQKYRFVTHKLIYKPGTSIFEYLTPGLMLKLLSSNLLRSYASYTRNLFRDKRLQYIINFPMLFLGAAPSKTPAIYSLINHANFGLGTWYPMGGMHKIAHAMEKVCQNFDVDITYNVEVDQFELLQDKVNSAHCNHRNFYGEYFVSSADYPYTDSHLIPDEKGNYSLKQWNKKDLAPSALIFYIGLNKKLPSLLHHNMFVDQGFKKQLNSISKSSHWPEEPSFFVTVASKTDASVAPEGCENLVVMIPVASGLDDSGKIREHYLNMLIEKLETVTKTSIREHIIYQKSYAHTDFVNDYHAFKGNAYGLANTRTQIGPFRPKLANRHLPNLYYTGHFTVPGSGIAPAIVSGEIVAREIYKTAVGRKS